MGDAVQVQKGVSATEIINSTVSIVGGSIQLDNAAGLQAWVAGQIGYDPGNLTVTIDSGVAGVRLQSGQEEWWLVCNKSGNPIVNGTPCYASGVTAGVCLEIGVADAAFPNKSVQTLGLATHTIANGANGLVTYRGMVRDFDTSLLDVATLAYLGSGVIVDEKPLYPNTRVSLGTIIKKHATEGSMLVSVTLFNRKPKTGPYGFTSTGVNAGTYHKGGFYQWETLSATLALGGSTTIGQATIAKAAHVGIVAGGVGTVTGGGQVGLQVTGVLDSELGTQVAAQTKVITDDITTLLLNDYVETVEKFSDVVTYELYIVSGTPSAASLTFNRGFSKYDDFEDIDYTITGLEVTWQGNANSTLDIALMHHRPLGWVYAASGFIAGNGDICRKSIDQQLAGDVANNQDGAYKRLDLNVFVNGKGVADEGHVVQIITGANGTIQSMDIRVDAVSEEL
jgi:hypothetical protein